MNEQIGIRINTLKTDPLKAAEYMYQQGAEISFPFPSVDWYVFVSGLEREMVVRWDLFDKGELYLQNPSSIVPVLVLNPQKEEHILDLCAAPGSKTSQMAQMILNQGTIVAVEKSRERMYKLRANLERLGVRQIECVQMDGRSYWQTGLGQFDAVLVDAPCSMNQSIPQKKIKQLVQQQKWLLRSAVSCLRPGGRLVYSVCTTTPEETERVVEWIVKKVPSEIEIDPVDISSLPPEAEKKASGLLIHGGGAWEGFFISALTKKQTPPIHIDGTVVSL